MPAKEESTHQVSSASQQILDGVCVYVWFVKGHKLLLCLSVASIAPALLCCVWDLVLERDQFCHDVQGRCLVLSSEQMCVANMIIITNLNCERGGQE